MTLKLEIVTPERVAYSESVDMVTVPAVTGTLGILPRHIPLFAQLTEGELKIKKGSEEIFLAIGGGFVEVTKEKVMVLVTRAVNAKELSEQEIKRAREQAEEALKQKPTGKELAAAQALLRQSLVDSRILMRRRSRVH
jgi:F-type H+-transporting ATPase subunit epsilon